MPVAASGVYAIGRYALPSQAETERVTDADQKTYTGHCTGSARHAEQVDYFRYEHDVRIRRDPGRDETSETAGPGVRSSTDRRPPQRSDHRREAILDALDNWLLESSLDAINIAEISKQAGVTRSAFYFYFENKGAAVAALMERILDAMFAVNDAFTTAAAPPRQRIYAMLDGLFSTCEEHRHLFKAMLAVRGSNAAVRNIWDDARESFVELVAAMIRADRSAGSAPDGLDADVMASVLLEFNDRLLERLTAGGSLSREQLMDGAAAIWLGTIYGITQASDAQETA